MTRLAPCVVGLTTARTMDGRIQIDGAASVVSEGEVIALAEERVTRRKYAGGSINALMACLDASGRTVGDVDLYCISTSGEAVPDDGADAAIGGQHGSIMLSDLGIPRDRIRWVPSHHLSHALSVTPPEADPGGLLVVADEAGTEVGRPRGGRINLERQTVFERSTDGSLKVLDVVATHQGSFGGIGSAFRHVSDYLGLDGRTESGKTMAMAAYDPGPHSGLPHLLAEGHFGLSTLAADSARAQRQLDWWLRRARIERRHPSQAVQMPHFTLAGLVQTALEDLLFDIVKRHITSVPPGPVQLAGGVALNCVAAGRLAARLGCSVDVPAAPGDTGQALGNAKWGATLLGMPFPKVEPFLGPPVDMARTDRAAAAWRDHFRVWRGEDVAGRVADHLLAGHVVAVYTGRSEVGPRALGHRSILADPRSAWMRDFLNGSVKKREWYRPYGVSALAEHVDQVVRMPLPSPAMMLAGEATETSRATLPAAVHVDGTVRFHTVGTKAPVLLRQIIEEWHSRTGVPAVLNTSFNRAGEPIVETPEEAVSSFAAMPLDAVVLGRVLIERQPPR